MLDELSNRLRDDLLSKLQRFRYFLLASAGAALAFTLSQSATDEVFSFTDMCWGLSVIAFGLSFFLGLMGVEASHSALMSNVAFIEIKKSWSKVGEHIGQNEDGTPSEYPRQFEEAVEKTQSDVARWQGKARRHNLAQKWLLFIGALLFGLMEFSIRMGFDPAIIFA